MEYQVYTDKIISISNAGTAVNLDTDEPDPQEFFLLTNASVYNESGEIVTVAFNLVDGAQVIQLGSKLTVQIGDAGERTWVTMLGPNQFLRAIVTGTALKNRISLYVAGFRVMPLVTPGFQGEEEVGS